MTSTRVRFAAALVAGVLAGGVFASVITKSQNNRNPYIFVPADQADGIADHFIFFTWVPGEARVRGSHPPVDLPVTPDGQDRGIGNFRYDRSLDTPGLDAPAGWVDGDRVAYQCGWAFLTYRQFIVGRVTYKMIRSAPIGDLSLFTQVEGWIGDKFMSEGIRHRDGRYDTEGELQFDAECTRSPSRPSLSPSTAFSTPVVTFYHGPHDVEIRDYGDAADADAIHPEMRFRIAARDSDGATVVAYWQRPDGHFAPVLEIAFDVMVPGVNVPGTIHPVQLRTNLSNAG